MHTQVALFWVAWAFVAEKAGNDKLTDRVFTKGIEQGAAPKDLLVSRQRHFHRRLARRCLKAQETPKNKKAASPDHDQSSPSSGAPPAPSAAHDAPLELPAPRASSAATPSQQRAAAAPAVAAPAPAAAVPMNGAQSKLSMAGTAADALSAMFDDSSSFAAPPPVPVAAPAPAPAARAPAVAPTFAVAPTPGVAKKTTFAVLGDENGGGGGGRRGGPPEHRAVAAKTPAAGAGRRRGLAPLAPSQTPDAGLGGGGAAAPVTGKRGGAKTPFGGGPMSVVAPTPAARRFDEDVTINTRTALKAMGDIFGKGSNGDDNDSDCGFGGGGEKGGGGDMFGWGDSFGPVVGAGGAAAQPAPFALRLLSAAMEEGEGDDDSGSNEKDRSPRPCLPFALAEETPERNDHGSGGGRGGGDGDSGLRPRGLAAGGAGLHGSCAENRRSGGLEGAVSPSTTGFAIYSDEAPATAPSPSVGFAIYSDEAPATAPSPSVGFAVYSDEAPAAVLAPAPERGGGFQIFCDDGGSPQLPRAAAASTAASAHASATPARALLVKALLPTAKSTPRASPAESPSRLNTMRGALAPGNAASLHRSAVAAGSSRRRQTVDPSALADMLKELVTPKKGSGGGGGDGGGGDSGAHGGRDRRRETIGEGIGAVLLAMGITPQKPAAAPAALTASVQKRRLCAEFASPSLLRGPLQGSLHQVAGGPKTSPLAPTPRSASGASTAASGRRRAAAAAAPLPLCTATRRETADPAALLEMLAQFRDGDDE